MTAKPIVWEEISESLWFGDAGEIWLFTIHMKSNFYALVINDYMLFRFLDIESDNRGYSRMLPEKHQTLEDAKQFAQSLLNQFKEAL